MTNKEWMATLTAEEFYDTMEWLIRVYSKQFTNSRLAITTWLDKEHERNKMDENKDLAEKIYWILIEEGQHNLKSPLGSIITNTPDEVRDIIRKHMKDLT